jgi:hypothetical protein
VIDALPEAVEEAFETLSIAANVMGAMLSRKRTLK